MLLASTWTVTLGGVTLLSADDWMDAEPSIAPAGIVESRQFLRAEFGEFRGRRGITHTVAFSRVKNCASPAAARAFLISHLRELPFAQPGADLAIAIAGEATYILSGAVLVPGGTFTTKNHQFTASYTLRGGELTELATADVLTTEGGDQLNTEGSDDITTE